MTPEEEALRCLPSLETLLTSPLGFGLVTASHLQRAVCRLIEGRALGALAFNTDVVAAIGEHAPSSTPKEVVLLSAIRAAKSMICAARAWNMARTCDLSMLAFGETPRVSIRSVYKDNARVVYDHLVGTMQHQPWMRALLVSEPKAESIVIRHKTGRPVEISIVAGARAGNTLVSRWSAGVIFDEAPRMSSADDHIVNYEHERQSVIGRLLPGAQILSVGSPWAPFGPVYEVVQTHWKKPESGPFVIWAPGWAMNPVYWTPERIAELKDKNPDAYQTDCAAQFASPEESLYTTHELDMCTRSSHDLEPHERATYTAAIDPATRGNSWTLVLATRDGRRIRVAVARQWTGNKLEPLSPRAVLAEIAEICRRYEIRHLRTDQWHGDSLADIAREYGLYVQQVEHSESERVRAYLNLKTKLSEGSVEIPPDTYLRNDMLRVKRRPTQRGSVAIVLPHTADGRHCDYAPSLILACNDWLRDLEPEPLPLDQAEQKRMRERVKKKWTQPAKRRAA